MIKWAMKKLPDGSFEGMVVMVPAANAGPWSKSKPIKLVAKSKTAAGALAKASSVAKMISKNPLLSAALPPGSGVALKAISYLSKSAAAGKLSSAAKKVTGKGAKRLYSALKSLW